MRKELLFQAIEDFNLPEVKRLVESGISLDVTDDSTFVSRDNRVIKRTTGYTPLELAKALRRTNIINYLESYEQNKKCN